MSTELPHAATPTQPPHAATSRSPPTQPPHAATPRSHRTQPPHAAVAATPRSYSRSYTATLRVALRAHLDAAHGEPEASRMYLPECLSKSGRPEEKSAAWGACGGRIFFSSLGVAWTRAGRRLDLATRRRVTSACGSRASSPPLCLFFTTRQRQRRAFFPLLSGSGYSGCKWPVLTVVARSARTL